MNVAVAMVAVLMSTAAFAQNNSASYPEPEFMQEIYAFNKGGSALVKLEKESSKLETKTKAMGWGGSESAYNFKGDKSDVRFSSAQLPSFVFRMRQDFSSGKDMMKNEPTRNDTSHMNQNASQFTSMMDEMMDPSKTIALYILDQRSGERALVMQSSPGKFSKKGKTSDKVVLSYRKIKEGYYEMVVDKPLPKGEYAFMNQMGGASQSTMFLFGVD
jgi:hypothetical protein